MRYMLIKLSDNSIDRIMNGAIDPNVQTKAGYKWLPCPFVEKPVVDEKLKTVEGPFYKVSVEDVTESWVKRDLTPDEVSAKKTARVLELGEDILKILSDLEDRIRTLEGRPKIDSKYVEIAKKVI